MVKVFIQNKPLFLTDELNNEAEEYLRRPRTAFVNELNESSVTNLLREMESDSVDAGVFRHSDTLEVLQALRKHLTLVQAAGGLVYTPGNELLLIFRRGKWDLPKGKLDEGETLEACALREIEEETGVANTTIIRPFIVTYHTYHEKGRHILKESHWFLIKSTGASPLKPQTEEDIEQCRWVPATSLSTYMSNMHASLVDLINEGMKQITDGV